MVPADSDLGRPALAVKIDNHPDALPQVGLDETDIVFEERVEGITRFLAVFWAHDVAGVGPIRSARTSDIDLLGSLGQPLLAWSGGNEGVVEAVADSDVIDVGVDRYPDLYYRESSRLAPHDLMSDTAQLLAAGREGASPPQAPFAVGEGAPAPAGSVASPGLDVDLDGVTASWAWDAASSRWARFQNGEAHLAESGAQLSAANVVVLGVDYFSSCGRRLLARGADGGGGGRRAAAARRNDGGGQLAAGLGQRTVHARRLGGCDRDAATRQHLGRAAPPRRDGGHERRAGGRPAGVALRQAWRSARQARRVSRRRARRAPARAGSGTPPCSAPAPRTAAADR